MTEPFDAPPSGECDRRLASMPIINIICLKLTKWNVLCCLCYHSSSGVCDKLDKWLVKSNNNVTSSQLSWAISCHCLVRSTINVNSSQQIMFSASIHDGRDPKQPTWSAVVNGHVQSVVPAVNMVSCGQRSCSIHGPSCQHGQLWSTVVFSSWCTLPTWSAAAVNSHVQSITDSSNKQCQQQSNVMFIVSLTGSSYWHCQYPVWMRMRFGCVSK